MSGDETDPNVSNPPVQTPTDVKGKQAESSSTAVPPVPDEDGCIPYYNEPCPAFEALEFFDIRNGDESDARSLLMKATIAKAYHWPTITGLPSAQAGLAMAAFIRSAYAQISAHSAENVPKEKKVKMATALGVVRCVATMQYRLEHVDFIPGEVCESYINVKPGPDGKLIFRQKRTNEPAVMEAMALNVDAILADTALISALMMSGLGVIPNQGYSLMMTNHHYLSDPASQSRKAFSVIEKQFWRATDVNQWFESDLTMLQDLIWHKSTHPVSITVKETLACDKRVAGMLRAAGAGSAASRLPAVEAVVRTANSYRTLMATVAPLFATFGGSIDYSLLDLAIEVVRSFPVGARTVGAGLPYTPDPRIPTNVTTRKLALDWLQAVTDRAQDTTAYCYGFYISLTEQSAMLGAAAGTNSLKSSFSLSKLPSTSHASYIAGTQSHGDYAAARSQLRMAGRFVPPKLVLT